MSGTGLSLLHRSTLEEEEEEEKNLLGRERETCFAAAPVRLYGAERNSIKFARVDRLLVLLLLNGCDILLLVLLFEF